MAHFPPGFPLEESEDAKKRRKAQLRAAMEEKARKDRLAAIEALNKAQQPITPEPEKDKKGKHRKK